MTTNAPHRNLRMNEVASFKTKEGETIAAIVKNFDGTHRVFLSKLSFDDEEEAYYWSDFMMPTGSIYETVAIAKSETEVIVGTLFEDTTQ